MSFLLSHISLLSFFFVLVIIHCYGRVMNTICLNNLTPSLPSWISRSHLNNMMVLPIKRSSEIITFNVDSIWQHWSILYNQEFGRLDTMVRTLMLCVDPTTTSWLLLLTISVSSTSLDSPAATPRYKLFRMCTIVCVFVKYNEWIPEAYNWMERGVQTLDSILPML